MGSILAKLVFSGMDRALAEGMAFRIGDSKTLLILAIEQIGTKECYCAVQCLHPYYLILEPSPCNFVPLA